MFEEIRSGSKSVDEENTQKSSIHCYASYASFNLGLGVLHSCLVIYLVAAYFLASETALTKQNLYDIRSNWTNTSGIVPACPDAEGDIFGSMNAILLLLVAEIFTALNHGLTWTSLTRRLNGVLDFLYFRSNGNESAMELHGIKITYFAEYSISASCMALVIFNVYGGYLDVKSSGWLFSGFALMMTCGTTLDFLRELRRLSTDSNLKLIADIQSFLLTLFAFSFLCTVWFPAMFQVFEPVDPPEKGAPDFVKAIVLSELVLFSSFGFVTSAFQTYSRYWTPSNYTALFMAEGYALAILSAGAKTVLVLILSVGAWF